MNAKDIVLLVIGVISICCINAIAFVFDAEWINVAISLDSVFIGSLSTYLFKGVSKVSKSNSLK